MPVNTNKYHIFKNGRSVCGKWLLFGKNSELCTDVTGKEKLGRDDCKACFKKAGLELQLSESNMEKSK